MIHACYKFLGKDESKDLTTGNKYYLMIYEFNWFERLFGDYPKNWKIVAFRPYDINTPMYPYRSWAEFNQNWHKLEPNMVHKTIPKTKKHHKNVLISH